MPNISGTVYKTGSDERVKYAVVKAYSKGKAPVIATTDDDGDFDFKNLEAGKWSLLVLDESSLPEKVSEFQLTKDRSNLKIELQRIADTKDLKVGTKLFLFHVDCFRRIGCVVHPAAYIYSPQGYTIT